MLESAKIQSVGVADAGPGVGGRDRNLGNGPVGAGDHEEGNHGAVALPAGKPPHVAALSQGDQLQGPPLLGQVGDEEGLGFRLGQAGVCGGILPVGGVVLSRVIAGVLRLAARVLVGGVGRGVCGGVPVVFVPFTGAV